MSEKDTLAIIAPLVALILSFIPESLGRWRGLIGDALLHFLSRLPARRVEAIIAAQLRLPPNCAPGKRLLALLRQSPTLHKLGQVVARDRRLSPDLRRRLQALESLAAAPVPPSVLARLGQVGAGNPKIHFARRTLAEGSVALAIPFVWRNPPDGLPARGIAKILRPGVKTKLAEDLIVWPDLGAFLEQRCHDHDLPVFDYSHTLDTVASLLANEIRFPQEQAQLARAYRVFGRLAPDIRVPRVYPGCRPDLTLMERLDGSGIAKLPTDDLTAGRRRAEQIVRGLISAPFWDRAEEFALFHADPHAGNLLATTDGRLGVLDWALVGELPLVLREHLVALILDILRRDPGAICAGIAQLGTVRDSGRLADDVRAALVTLRPAEFPGFAWLTALFDGLAGGGTVRFHPELLLFRKTLLTLEGVLNDLDAAPPFDSILIADGLGQLLGTLPWRLWSASRPAACYGHIDSRQLAEFLFDLPIIWTRHLAAWLGR